MSLPTGDTNKIRDAMIAAITAQQANLGLRKIGADLSLDNLADDVEKLVIQFPAVIAVYAGSTGRREGSALVRRPTFALVVCDRNVSGPHASVSSTNDLLDALREIVCNNNVALCPQQNGAFEFVSEALHVMNFAMTAYVMLFDTEIVKSRRGL